MSEEQKVNWKGMKIFLGVMAAIILGPIILVTIIVVTASMRLEEEKKECFYTCMIKVSPYQPDYEQLANRCKSFCEESRGN